ncbi:MAG: hypothetical protein GY934_11480 [Gammaproteobacteria bacterium]|nr:hypothetical protein [Gammaproteobacteria bacterium]
MENIQNYKAICISKDGCREELDAQKIIIELALDKQITIELSQHPSGLTIGDIVEPDPDLIPTHFSVLTIRPGACNIIHVDVDRYQRSEEQV